jgi:hypothetical protein
VVNAAAEASHDRVVVPLENLGAIDYLGRYPDMFNGVVADLKKNWPDAKEVWRGVAS